MSVRQLNSSWMWFFLLFIKLLNWRTWISGLMEYDFCYNFAIKQLQKTCEIVRKHCEFAIKHYSKPKTVLPQREKRMPRQSTDWNRSIISENNVSRRTYVIRCVILFLSKRNVKRIKSQKLMIYVDFVFVKIVLLTKNLLTLIFSRDSA